MSTTSHVSVNPLDSRSIQYEERTRKWIDDHFRLRQQQLSYPYVDCHCNGCGSFWIETAPRTRQMFIASVAIIIEHIVNGLVLPVCYLCTHNQLYFGLAMYGEVAFMIYTSSLTAVSYLTGRDVTVEQMHPAVWPLLLLHHFSALVLCIGCILIGGFHITWILKLKGVFYF